MRRFLRASLTSNGYRVLEAGTLAEAGLVATSHNPELYLVDLGLPDGDGIDLTRSLRAWTAAPVIVLSARGRELDKVAALDAGADDYLTKPFGVGELLARLRVAIRHREALAKHADEPVIEVEDLKIDLARREVAVGDRAVRLTATEYRLLVLLARNAGRVLTHRQLLTHVWGPQYETETHYLRPVITALRRKLVPQLIRTEPGVGYRLQPLVG